MRFTVRFHDYTGNAERVMEGDVVVGTKERKKETENSQINNSDW